MSDLAQPDPKLRKRKKKKRRVLRVDSDDEAGPGDSLASIDLTSWAVQQGRSSAKKKKKKRARALAATVGSTAEPDDISHLHSRIEYDRWKLVKFGNGSLRFTMAPGQSPPPADTPSLQSSGKQKPGQRPFFQKRRTGREPVTLCIRQADMHRNMQEVFAGGTAFAPELLIARPAPYRKGNRPGWFFLDADVMLLGLGDNSEKLANLPIPVSETLAARTAAAQEARRAAVAAQEAKMAAGADTGSLEVSDLERFTFSRGAAPQPQAATDEPVFESWQPKTIVSAKDRICTAKGFKAAAAADEDEATRNTKLSRLRGFRVMRGGHPLAYCFMDAFVRHSWWNSGLQDRCAWIERVLAGDPSTWLVPFLSEWRSEWTFTDLHKIPHVVSPALFKKMPLSLRRRIRHNMTAAARRVVFAYYALMSIVMVRGDTGLPGGLALGLGCFAAYGSPMGNECRYVFRIFNELVGSMHVAPPWRPWANRGARNDMKEAWTDLYERTYNGGSWRAANENLGRQALRLLIVGQPPGPQIGRFGVPKVLDRLPDGAVCPTNLYSTNRCLLRVLRDIQARHKHPCLRLYWKHRLGQMVDSGALTREQGIGLARVLRSAVGLLIGPGGTGKSFSVRRLRHMMGIKFLFFGATCNAIQVISANDPGAKKAVREAKLRPYTPSCRVDCCPRPKGSLPSSEEMAELAAALAEEEAELQTMAEPGAAAADGGDEVVGPPPSATDTGDPDSGVVHLPVSVGDVLGGGGAAPAQQPAPVTEPAQRAARVAKGDPSSGKPAIAGTCLELNRAYTMAYARTRFSDGTGGLEPNEDLCCLVLEEADQISISELLWLLLKLRRLVPNIISIVMLGDVRQMPSMSPGSLCTFVKRCFPASTSTLRTVHRGRTSSGRLSSVQRMAMSLRPVEDYQGGEESGADEMGLPPLQPPTVAPAAPAVEVPKTPAAAQEVSPPTQTSEPASVQAEEETAEDREERLRRAKVEKKRRKKKKKKTQLERMLEAFVEDDESLAQKTEAKLARDKAAADRAVHDPAAVHHLLGSGAAGDQAGDEDLPVAGASAGPDKAEALALALGKGEAKEFPKIKEFLTKLHRPIPTKPMDSAQLAKILHRTVDTPSLVQKVRSLFQSQEFTAMGKIRRATLARMLAYKSMPNWVMIGALSRMVMFLNSVVCGHPSGTLTGRVAAKPFQSFGHSSSSNKPPELPIRGLRLGDRICVSSVSALDRALSRPGIQWTQSSLDAFNSHTEGTPADNRRAARKMVSRGNRDQSSRYRVVETANGLVGYVMEITDWSVERAHGSAGGGGGQRSRSSRSSGSSTDEEQRRAEARQRLKEKKGMPDPDAPALALRLVTTNGMPADPEWNPGGNWPGRLRNSHHPLLGSEERQTQHKREVENRVEQDAIRDEEALASWMMQQQGLQADVPAGLTPLGARQAGDEKKKNQEDPAMAATANLQAALALQTAQADEERKRVSAARSINRLLGHWRRVVVCVKVGKPPAPVTYPTAPESQQAGGDEGKEPKDDDMSKTAIAIIWCGDQHCTQLRLNWACSPLRVQGKQFKQGFLVLPEGVGSPGNFAIGNLVYMSWTRFEQWFRIYIHTMCQCPASARRCTCGKGQETRYPNTNQGVLDMIASRFSERYNAGEVSKLKGQSVGFSETMGAGNRKTRLRIEDQTGRDLGEDSEEDALDPEDAALDKLTDMERWMATGTTANSVRIRKRAPGSSRRDTAPPPTSPPLTQAASPTASTQPPPLLPAPQPPAKKKRKKSKSAAAASRQPVAKAEPKPTKANLQHEGFGHEDDIDQDALEAELAMEMEETEVPVTQGGHTSTDRQASPTDTLSEPPADPSDPLSYPMSDAERFQCMVLKTIPTRIQQLMRKAQ